MSYELELEYEFVCVRVLVLCTAGMCRMKESEAFACDDNVRSKPFH